MPNLSALITSLSPFTLVYFAAALIGFGTIIVIHELGHFLFCKIFGIKTPTFSVGFGPKIISTHIGDTEFTLSAIPLGGYVEIAGMVEGVEGETTPISPYHSFSAKPFIQKFLVLLGGIFFNLIFAYAVFISLSFTNQMPERFRAPFNRMTTIKAIVPNSAAEALGMQAGDTIIKINETPIEGSLLPRSILSTAISSITLMRNNQEIAITKPETTINPLAGISFDIAPTATPGTIAAALEGSQLATNWLIVTAQGFISIFTTRNIQGLSGPVRILADMKQAAHDGLTNLLAILAIISLNLGILNLIPLPILDGGQLLIVTVESLRGKPLSISSREKIAIATWLLMLTLALALTIQDLRHILAPLFTCCN